MSVVRQTGLTNRSPLSAGAERGDVTIRGVVIATYAADEEDRPSIVGEGKATYEPKSVHCDVLTYGGRYRYFLPRVPVVQVRHGLNDHTSLWIPRATKINIASGIAPRLVRDEAGPADDPRDFDGDHVIVQFFEDDPQQPFIFGALPHPRATFRITKDLGELKRTRHRGVVAAVDAAGNVTLDTRGANSGAIETPAGTEPAVEDDGHGNVTVHMNRAASLTVVGARTDGSLETFQLAMSEGEFVVKLSNGESLTLVDKDALAQLKVGNGAVHAAIVEHLQALWTQMLTRDTTFTAALIAYLTTIQTDITAMLAALGLTGSSTAGATAFATASGSTNPPTPAWDATINSGKLSFPDG